jgi:predicted amidohydrolase
VCLAFWNAISPQKGQPNVIWDFLLPESDGSDHVRFSRRIVAPPGAKQLTVRATLRWTATGKTVWQPPRVAVAQEPIKKTAPVRVCAVTGHHTQRLAHKFLSPQDNIEFYGSLCETACREHRPQLIVLPEIALQFGLPGSPLDLAVPAPGPETNAFAAIARRHRVRIALGMLERNEDAVHNSVVLIGPTGAIDGRYRKVHLAIGEDCSGILPGDSFPVFSTELGRIGCNICKDSSVAESARMVGLNGADLLVLPIMGDPRADRWSKGPGIFSEDRWRVIMRAHAIENQICMIVARNAALGSCILDRKGEVLAWNEGDQAFIAADVSFDDDYRMWQGGSFRDANWLQRRPHLYGASTDPARHGGAK